MPAVDDPNSVAASLAGQIAELRRQVKDLSTNQTGLDPAIQALLTNQVVPQVNSAASFTYTLTTSFQTVASFNFTTPAGYTRAVILAQGAVTMLSNTASGEFGYARILIGGTAGQEGRFSFNAPSTDPSVPAYSSRILSGLTDGQNVLVEVQARLINGPGFTLSITQSGSVNGMALFQK